MNPYTTMGQTRIEHRDITNVLRTHSYMGGAAIGALERQRGGQAEAAYYSLLKQNGVEPNSGTSLVSMLRQTIGAVLVRTGQRLAGTPHSNVSREASPTLSNG